MAKLLQEMVSTKNKGDGFGYDSNSVKRFTRGVKRRNPNEPEFCQAVEEVAHSVIPYLKNRPNLSNAIVLERLTEPERIFVFRVIWEDDGGNMRLNRGYRIQHSNALGPYKGGLRFHPTVNLSVLKFLAFEQTFKNSLTGLSLGAAKGGADFNPRGKSDREVLRFCKSFMLELYKHIGPNLDVPAGDIGVGEREIGFLFGQYKRITGEFVPSVLTGKGLESSGSLIRREATGYGAVYFAQEAMLHVGDSIKDKVCVVSGSGNVATYCAEKIVELGGKVVSLSDSDGFVYDEDGIDQEKINFVKELKTVKRGRIKEYADKYKKAVFYEGKKPWHISCDIAFPCATQNEISKDDAEGLVSGGCRMVVEGANMPTSKQAVEVLEGKVLLAPGKAANAGGVAISGIEMVQNRQSVSFSRATMEERLKQIMGHIHKECVTYGSVDNKNNVDYVKGANLAGFVRVADAMLAHGV